MSRKADGGKEVNSAVFTQRMCLRNARVPHGIMLNMNKYIFARQRNSNVRHFLLANDGVRICYSNSSHYRH